jgi:hypothetical protein
MAQVKRLARDTGRTMTQVIEDALRAAIARKTAEPPRHVGLPTFRGSGLQPGVDLDSGAALLDLMEQNDRSL